jgi:cell division protein FtsW
VTSTTVRHPGELRWETRLLAVLTLVLVALGIAVCYAAGSYREDWYAEAQQQLSGAVLGGLLFLLAAGIDYRLLRTWARPLFYATIAGLALIAFVAVVWRDKRAPAPLGSFVPYYNGSRRWLSLFGIQVQLSEIARFTVPVMVAALVTEAGPRIRKFNEGFLPVVRPIVIAAALVAVQPNLSMAVLLTCLTMSVVFVAGAKISHLLLLGAIGAAGGGTMLVLNAEKSARLEEYLAPAANCSIDSQVCNSLIGLGNGGLVGVGFGEGTQKLGRLAYGYSDFILSVLGEEWGFIGVVFVVVCFVLFCWMGFRIAKTAPDLFGTTLAGGLTAMVGIAALLHAAVVLKMIPSTGLTLPFISAGRVSLVIYLVSAGVLVSIGRRRGKPSRAR